MRRYFDPDLAHPQAPADLRYAFYKDVAFALGLVSTFPVFGSLWLQCSGCREKWAAGSTLTRRWWLCSRRCMDSEQNRQTVRVFWYRAFVAPGFVAPGWFGRRFFHEDDGPRVEFDHHFLALIGVTRGGGEEPLRCLRCAQGWWNDELPAGRRGRDWWRCPNDCAKSDHMRLAAVARRRVGYVRVGQAELGDPYSSAGWEPPNLAQWKRRTVREVFDLVPVEWRSPRKLPVLPSAAVSAWAKRAERREREAAADLAECQHRRYLRTVRDSVPQDLEIEAAVTARLAIRHGSNYTNVVCKCCARRWRPWSLDGYGFDQREVRGPIPWWMCRGGCNRRLAARVLALAKSETEREFLTGEPAQPAQGRRERRAA
jgi:hypothetical protein